MQLLSRRENYWRRSRAFTVLRMSEQEVDAGKERMCGTSTNRAAQTSLTRRARTASASSEYRARQDQSMGRALARVGLAPVRGVVVIQFVSPRTGIDLPSMSSGISHRMGVCAGRSSAHRARHSSHV